jgi:sodium/bile acid cotransporter 7
VLGIFLTPLLVGLLIGATAGERGFDWGAVQGIVLQLLLPFIAGHLLRPMIGEFVNRHKKILMPVDRGSILLVVFSAFSAAVVNGIWSRIDFADLLSLLLVSAVILALVMLINVAMARISKMPREDFIVLLFCGSKKSLVSGVPMAGALFAPAQVGMVVLPLMIFHQLQLFVCAWLAARFARQYDEAHEGEAMNSVPAEIPLAPDAIEAAAAAHGIVLPEDARPGVEANLALLARHAATLRGDPGPEGR